jgi:hypothetical protein
VSKQADPNETETQGKVTQEKSPLFELEKPSRFELRTNQKHSAWLSLELASFPLMKGTPKNASPESEP